MGVNERLAEVGHDLGDVAVAEVAGRLELGQGVAGDQLGDQNGVAIVLAELVERHDRRVIQACRRLGLAHHSVGVGGASSFLTATWRWRRSSKAR